MKYVRYALFCILVLILSIYLRRPADMPKNEGAIVDQVRGLLPGGGDESDSFRNPDDEGDVDDGADGGAVNGQDGQDEQDDEDDSVDGDDGEDEDEEDEDETEE